MKTPYSNLSLTHLWHPTPLNLAIHTPDHDTMISSTLAAVMALVEHQQRHLVQREQLAGVLLDDNRLRVEQLGQDLRCHADDVVRAYRLEDSGQILSFADACGNGLVVSIDR